MAEFASKGVAGSALGLGIAGLSVALLNNGGLGGGKVTMYGVTFDSTDIDALFEMARKYSDS